MATSAHVKKGDNVIVLAGAKAIKGKSGKILRVIPAKNQVIIEGVRIIKKHQKANQAHPQGGILEREGPVHISNVRLVEAPVEAKPVAKKTAKKTK